MVGILVHVLFVVRTKYTTEEDIVLVRFFEVLNKSVTIGSLFYVPSGAGSKRDLRIPLEGGVQPHEKVLGYSLHVCDCQSHAGGINICFTYTEYHRLYMLQSI